MYAVIESGGKQYRVAVGQYLKLEKITVSEGEAFNFEKVLMVGEGEQIKVGAPFLTNAVVRGEVMEHGRRDKIRVIKFRRRKHYRRQMGHRQHYTQVKITEIAGG